MYLARTIADLEAWLAQVQVVKLYLEDEEV